MAWLLPSAAATDTVCVTLNVPNTSQDIRNFFGQIYELGQWYNYERDGGTLATEVAQTWAAALQTIVVNGCQEMIRLNPDNACQLEVWNAETEEWDLLADFSDCVTETVIENLNSGTALGQALQTFVNNYYSSSTEPTESNSYAGNPAIGGNDCSKDVVWGQSGKLVDYIHSSVEQFFEELAVTSTVSDRIEAFIDIVPVLGDAIEAVVNYITETGAAFLTSYDASWTDGLRDSIVCDIFCLALDKEDCRLTIFDLIDYYYAKFNQVTDPSNQLNSSATLDVFARLSLTIGQAGGLVYVGDDLVYSCHLFLLVALAIGDTFAGVNSAADLYIEALDSVPSPGWASECPDCVEGWVHVFDFSGGDQQGWALLFPGWGSWGGDGWDGVDFSQGGAARRGVWIVRTIPTPSNVKNVTMIYDLEFGVQAAADMAGVYTTRWWGTVLSDVIEGNLQFNGDLDDPAAIGCFIFSSRDTAGAGSSRISQVIMSGDGDDPFV